MLRERIAEDVAFFSSDLYAQVCAGVIGTPDGAILIDTLALPAETQEIRDYIQHADELDRAVHHQHPSSRGSLRRELFFPGSADHLARIVPNLMDSKDRGALASAKQENKDLSNAQIILPNVTFKEGSIYFLVGKRTIRLFPLPGHTPDGIGVLLEEERILFAGDAMMPLPFFRDGDMDQLVSTLKTITAMGLENIVQGHGDVILRGEIDEMIASHLIYLDRVKKEALNAVRWNWPVEDLRQIPIEKCGKSRILLNGLAPDLHYQNLVAAYQKIRREENVAREPRKPAGR